MAASQPSAFDAASTAEDVCAAFAAEAAGRLFLVTGAGSGLGYETARVLALHGARVVVSTRSAASADAAVAKLKAAQPTADVTPLVLDLSSLKSVATGAAAYLKAHDTLDVLINNAGVMASPFTLTADGLEEQIALSKAGTPSRPSRVVNVSSAGHWLLAQPEGINFDGLHPADPKRYSSWERYGETKLANILHAKELTARCKAKGLNVIGVSVHPGGILDTKLSRYLGLSSAADFFWQMWRRGGGRLAVVLSGRGQKKISAGAATQVLAALDPTVVPGAYYVDCRVAVKEVAPAAEDAALASRLASYTDALIEKLLKA